MAKTRQSNGVTARTLASVTGKIISAYLAVGSMTRIMTKAIHCAIESKSSWNSNVLLSAQAQEELTFWLQNIEQLKAKPINYVASCSKVVYSDASTHGFAGYVVDADDSISHVHWAST